MNQNPKTDQPNSDIQRTQQLNFKVPPDFYWKLKNFATEKRCRMVDVLEKAFSFYEKREKIVNEINIYRQNIQIIEEKMKAFQGQINQEELKLGIKNLDPIIFQKIGLVITYSILRGALEKFLYNY